MSHTEIKYTPESKFDILKSCSAPKLQLKNSNPAINGGKNAATYKKIEQENSKILAFKREKEGEKVTFLGNFSPNQEQVTNPSVGALDYASGGVESKEIISLEPWSFRILVEK